MCVSVALTIALLCTVFWVGGRTAAPLLLFSAVVAVCAGLAWRLATLLRAIVERDIRDEKRRQQLERGEKPRGTLFGEDSELSIEVPPREKLEIFVAIHQRVIIGATLVVFGFLYIYLLGQESSLAGVGSKQAAPLGICYFVMGFVALVAGKFLSAAFDSSQQRALWAIAILCRTLTFLFALTGVCVLPAAYGIIAFEHIAGWATLVLLGIFFVELAANWVLSFFHPPVEEAQIRLPYDSAVLEVPFATMHPVEKVLRSVERQFGVNLRNTWAVRFLRAAILPLILVQLAALWTLTSFTVVNPDEIGILEHFGRPVSNEPVLPGLHVTRPWPIDHIRRFPANRVATLTLGYEGARIAKHYLWSKRHFKRDYRLLLGNGRELMSLQAAIYYRIRDVFAYAYNNSNPVETLRSIAYSIVTDEMIRRNLDTVLAEGRQEFADAITRRIRKAVDSPVLGPLGIEVLDVALKGAHPPVEIAPAYQDVVSAQIEEVTKLRRGQEYAVKTLPKAQAQADVQVSKAKSYSERRVGKAQGESEWFLTVWNVYTKYRELYRFRRYLETLESDLAEAEPVVVDHTIEHGVDYWLDFRPKGQEEKP